MKQHRILWWAAGSLLVAMCVGLIWAAYQFSWSSTGFVGKTVWDWLQLLIVPLVLAFGAVVFNQVNTYTERETAQQRYERDQQIALDKQREDLLQNYLDRMSELLLEKNLRVSKPGEEVRNIARVRTLSTLIQLDATRVGYVFAFLGEANLMEHTDPIISLDDANLRNLKWSGADLYEVNLSGANLYKADLSEANLYGANLSEANLYGASLNGAYLEGADLDLADLEGASLKDATLIRANLSRADLSRANLKGASLSMANLYGADLKGANLSGASFGLADLSDADLSGANLSGADLKGANLSGANLKGVNLKEVLIEKEKLSIEQQAQVIWT